MSIKLQKHQKKVNRLVKSSIAFTFFFGINSVLYINSQNNFKDYSSHNWENYYKWSCRKSFRSWDRVSPRFDRKREYLFKWYNFRYE